MPDGRDGSLVLDGGQEGAPPSLGVIEQGCGPVLGDVFEPASDLASPGSDSVVEEVVRRLSVLEGDERESFRDATCRVLVQSNFVGVPLPAGLLGLASFPGGPVCGHDQESLLPVAVLDRNLRTSGGGPGGEWILVAS